MAGVSRSVEGYLFLTEEDAELAKEEIDRINYISSKMNENNPQAILAVYNRMIQNNTLVTPVGQEYLRTIRDYLYRTSQIPDEMVSDIPVIVSYSEAIKKKDEKPKAPERKRKTYKKEYQGALWVIAALVVMVIVMFVIALKSDVPNIINYKTAIENEYASWEQELAEREKAVREREEELDIY